MSSSRVLDDQGNVITHITNHRDITQEKQAVEALRESEEKYRTLFADSKDATFITTRNGKFIDFNQSFLDLFGYTEEEIKKVIPSRDTLIPMTELLLKKRLRKRDQLQTLKLRYGRRMEQKYTP